MDITEKCPNCGNNKTEEHVLEFENKKSIIKELYYNFCSVCSHEW